MNVARIRETGANVIGQDDDVDARFLPVALFHILLFDCQRRPALAGNCPFR